MIRAHAPTQINAVDDIAPLVRAAHLQIAAETTRQFHKIIALQDHVVELDEGEFLLALKPELDRIHRQHPVDREVATNIAQHVDIVELGQPVGIIDHHRIACARAIAQKLRKNALDTVLVCIDLLDCQEFAGFILAGRVPDTCCAAAHQGDRLVARHL